MEDGGMKQADNDIAGQDGSKKSSKSNRGFYFLIFFAACLALYLGYKWEMADPPGYCAAQNRSLTDDEFIELAVKEEFKSHHMNIDGSAASISGFHAKNPNCCRVLYRDEASLLDRMFHLQRVMVHFVFERKPEDVSRYDKNDKYYESYVEFNTCGRVLNTAGITTKFNEVKY
jgi:hypothetical protein